MATTMVHKVAMSRRQEVNFVMVERTVEPTILRNFDDV